MPKDKNDLTIQEQLEGLEKAKTNWQKILEKLCIKQVLAWSPQAKGRIERLWKTLQGKLPHEFIFNKIKDIDNANIFLKTYIKVFNKRYARKAKKEVLAYRVPKEHYKDDICSIITRKVNGAGVFSFHSYKFLVKAKSCVKTDIELRIYKDKIKAYWQGRYYDIEALDEFTSGLGETMSESLKTIIQKYLFQNAKSALSA